MRLGTENHHAIEPMLHLRYLLKNIDGFVLVLNGSSHFSKLVVERSQRSKTNRHVYVVFTVVQFRENLYCFKVALDSLVWLVSHA